MRQPLACCLIAALVAGPGCVKTAYIVPAPAVGVEVPGPESVVVGRPATPKPRYQVAIQQRCIHWDTAKAVGTERREVRAEVDTNRHVKLVIGGVLAVLGLVPLVGGVSMIAQPPENGNGNALASLGDGFKDLIGMWLAAVGVGMEAAGISLLVSGARDPCASPPHLPLPLAATATAG